MKGCMDLCAWAYAWFTAKMLCCMLYVRVRFTCACQLVWAYAIGLLWISLGGLVSYVPVALSLPPTLNTCAAAKYRSQTINYW